MLEFMKEQSDQPQNKAADQKPNVTAENIEEQSAKSEYLTISAQKKKTQTSNIAIIAIFIAGLISLVLMISQSSPKSAQANTQSLEQAKIEQAISKITGVRSEMFSGLEKIVNKFYEFSDIRQVGVNELVKNPFELELYMNGSAGKNGAGLQISKSSVVDQKFRDNAESLQLYSIMLSGSKNCAMINDKILYEGDAIQGLRVEKIDDNSVKLKGGDIELELKLIQ